MTADIILIFAAYCMSVVALLVSIYALWTLDEIKELYRQKKIKSDSAWNHYHNKAKEKTKPKSHWD